MLQNGDTGTLVKLDLGVLNQFGPTRTFVVQKLAKFLRRATFWKGVSLAKPLDHFGRLERRVNFLIEAPHDGGRRAKRRNNAEPS